MRRILIAFCLIAFGIAACDYTGGADSFPGTTPASQPPSPPRETPKDFVPPQNSRSVSVPSAISPGKLRGKTCADLKPKLDRIRQDSGQQGVDRADDEILAGYPSSPDWAVFTDEQRRASIDGTHDAANGTCPAR